MSILEDVLIEEYDRCRRHKQARLNALKECSRGSAEYRQHKQALRNIKKDLRMLHRALGPFVYVKWRRWVKAENHRRLTTKEE